MFSNTKEIYLWALERNSLRSLNSLCWEEGRKEGLNIDGFSNIASAVVETSLSYSDVLDDIFAFVQK
jgi:hypothetical protein